jgi:hypothetical protein
MSKGREAQIGDRNVAANGYTYEKTIKGWRLLHHIIAENTRRIKEPDFELDTKKYSVRFKDGDRTNFDPDNIVIKEKVNKKSGSAYQRALQSIEDKVFLFVEHAEDKSQALSDLKDMVSDARISHGFSALK